MTGQDNALLAELQARVTKQNRQIDELEAEVRELANRITRLCGGEVVDGVADATLAAVWRAREALAQEAARRRMRRMRRVREAEEARIRQLAYWRAEDQADGDDDQVDEEPTGSHGPERMHGDEAPAGAVEDEQAGSDVGEVPR